MVALNPFRSQQVRQSKTNLVLTHGWGMNSRVWSMALPRLESAFEVHALDLPGHGANTGRAVGHALEDWADALLARAPARAVWVGWSLGGLVALTAARRAPEKIDALVLVASSPKFAQAADWPHAIAPELLHKFESELKGNYRQLLEDFIVLQSMGASNLREEARALRKYLHEGGEPAPEALGVGLKFLLDTDLRAVLARLDQPCLLLLGERDKLVPAALVETLRRDCPRVETRVIKGSGHAPFLSHAAEFADALSGWIKHSGTEAASL